MRDSIGSAATLTVIIFFIALALSYLAFNVNYTKAFRMKNKIITVYDDFDGNCSTKKCHKAIGDYADVLGYGSDFPLPCSDGYENVNIEGKNNLYCVKWVQTQDPTEDTNEYKGYYSIETKINIDIPIINNLLDLKIFRITGDTRTFTFTKEG